MTKNKNTTLIAINNDYIEWVNSQDLENRTKFTKKEITEFVNEVLYNHKKSYDDLAE